MFWSTARRWGRGAPKPLVGVLCCNEHHQRPVQAVATRFIKPLNDIAGVDVLLVPALPGVVDAKSLAQRLDGLLLTGSRSNVSPSAYGREDNCSDLDPARDETALSLASELIENGKPVFGVCRGLQELNVLFGGTLRGDVAEAHRHPGSEALEFEAWFDHRHGVKLVPGGVLGSSWFESKRIEVTSVHGQGVEKLGSGLVIEATAEEDGLIEAVSSNSTGATVLGVQWHPEWDSERCRTSRRFFELLGRASADAGRRVPA